MSQTIIFVWIIQAPTMSKHISRNRGAKIKASQKTAHDKVFFYFEAKRPFFSKNGGTIKKKLYP